MSKTYDVQRLEGSKWITISSGCSSEQSAIQNGQAQKASHKDRQYRIIESKSQSVVTIL